MDGDAWFERYIINGRRQRGLTPTGWKGRATIAAFVFAMVGGGILFLLIALSTGNIALGAAVFGICAVLGGGLLTWASAARTRVIPYELSARAQQGVRLSWTPARIAASIFSAFVGGAVVFAVVDFITKSDFDASVAACIIALAGAATTVWAANLAQRAQDRADA